MLKNPFNNNSLVSKYKTLINQINILESQLKTLTDSELRAKSLKLKKRYELDQNLDSLITESFALTREASETTTGPEYITLTDPDGNNILIGAPNASSNIPYGGYNPGKGRVLFLNIEE